MAFEDAGWLLGEIEELQDNLKANELTGYYLTSGTDVLATATVKSTRNTSEPSLLSGFVSKYSGNVTLSITIKNNTDRTISSGSMFFKNANGKEITFSSSQINSNASYTTTATIALESNSPWQVYGSSYTNVQGATVNTSFTWAIKGTVNKFENPVVATI